ncbi:MULTISPECIES: DUF6879 family protein [Streptomycetaceae]|uniref:DUF6879 domain-containing protein n=1 Tax=Streptantibioticus cattleyicolor (strain ATCC 35852 / DSM 46488 / JCM 4925 / NBRC 14057 / NRRL 8057) TaxID=1003195 RepID=F8JVD4_STREN|nr:DUF6879 family protein [Streptantibioticus cattleyicolor]AEW94415.1 hypothetical protein SCATT_20440 [Streptantibioticus cattleyicolor NRRL 8057 = DSM 46488]MYS59063.1 hypothetical protein [Streptomyces sp. SID5468]CCB74773.1 conserved protein of unknown function [Streptantibioticus cattleyicolor NRRL 8057 = DSM 46488]
MLLAGDDWRRAFDAMEYEAWRLETLPVYRVPQEEDAIRRFLAGEPVTRQATQPWFDRVQAYVASGRSVGRVHIVTQPLSDYLRFEFDHYRHNVEAGEAVRVLDVTNRPNPLDGVQDFWMFDRSRIVLMHYEADGTQVSREVYGGDPEPFREYQRIALAESVPFEEYVKGLDA